MLTKQLKFRKAQVDLRSLPSMQSHYPLSKALLYMQVARILLPLMYCTVAIN
jgi:hypothetical protein